MKKSFQTSLLLVALLGCGGANRQDTHLVSGTITLNGEPVSDAHIVFHPTDGIGMIARGKTDDDGYYSLTTFDTGDGAMAGEYKVTISKVDTSANVVSQEVDLDNPGELYDSMMTEGDAEIPLEDVLPAEYANPETTPESRTVQEGENSFSFDLSN